MFRVYCSCICHTFITSSETDNLNHLLFLATKIWISGLGFFFFSCDLMSIIVRAHECCCKTCYRTITGGEFFKTIVGSGVNGCRRTASIHLLAL